MKKAQQEIVGFVLIVVLVVVGLMVYFVISLRTTGVEMASAKAGNMLDAVMKMTTDCAVVFEPDFENYEDLFGSCYKNEVCKNLNKDSCVYLNESLGKVLEDLVKSEADINYYKFELFAKDGRGILEMSWGNCTGQVRGAERIISKDNQKIIARITLCS